MVETSGTSPKTLDYWTQSEEYKDWDWTGKVLKLTDPSEETINSDSIRTFASGKKCSHTLIDQRHVELNIIGKPAFTITSYQSSLDIEGERRWEFLHVDETDEVDKQVVVNACEKRIGNGRKEPEKNSALRQGLKHGLKPYKVVIPFAKIIPKIFPMKTGDVRTKIDSFLDYIASSTVLHQYQREKNDQGGLIATLFDYDVAVFVFTVLKGKTGKSLNDKEQILVNYLSTQNEPQDISEIEEGCAINKQWMYDNRNKLIDKKIIKSKIKMKPCGNNEREVSAYVLVENVFNPLPYSDTILRRFYDDFKTILRNEYMEDIKDIKIKSELKIIIDKINVNRKGHGLKQFEINFLNLSESDIITLKSLISSENVNLNIAPNHLNIVPSFSPETKEQKEKRLLKEFSDNVNFEG